jgi:hypothetical protein
MPSALTWASLDQSSSDSSSALLCKQGVDVAEAVISLAGGHDTRVFASAVKVYTYKGRYRVVPLNVVIVNSASRQYLPQVLPNLLVSVNGP